MLAQPLAVPGSAAPDGSVPSELRVAFQRFLAVKLFGGIHLAWSWHTPQGLALQLVGGLGSFALCFRRTAPLGTLIWFTLIGLQLVRTWPYTLCFHFASPVFRSRRYTVPMPSPTPR